VLDHFVSAMIAVDSSALIAILFDEPKKPAKRVAQGKLLNGRRLIMTRLTIVAAIGVLSVPIPLPAAAGSEPAGHR
jgi:hypothetical protein